MKSNKTGSTGKKPSMALEVVAFEDLGPRVVGYVPPPRSIAEETLAEVRSIRAMLETRDVAPMLPVSGAELLSVDAARAALGISRSHLYNLMERGDVPYVMVGRARRIARADLDRYVAAQRRG